MSHKPPPLNRHLANVGVYPYLPRYDPCRGLRPLVGRDGEHEVVGKN